MTEEVWTPLRLINWTKDHLARKGIESPRLEAEVLLSAALGCERIDLYTRYGEAVPSDALAVFREMVKRRAAREPTQYILGRTEFCGHVFKTDPRALIPRGETEIIIQVTTELVKGSPELLIADIGTGSGVLAVTAALAFPQARLVACDISAEALSLAHENAVSHGVLERITLRCGDFEEVLGEFEGHVDVAMANPPYVSEREFTALAPELRGHEPREALVAGDDGTEVERRVVGFAARLLKPGGRLVMEMGASHAPRVRQVTDETAALELVRMEKDFAGIERVALIGKKQ